MNARVGQCAVQPTGPDTVNQTLALLIRVLLIALLLAAWEWGARTGQLNPFFYSSPVAIAHRLSTWLMEGTIWQHLWVTVSEMVVGFLLGALLGMVAGYGVARSAWLDAVFAPIAAILNSIPRVILAPLFILWFGLGFWSKVALVISLVSLLIFFSTYQAVKDVNPLLVANARILGADGWHLSRHVLIPAALSWILNGLRVSAGFALVGAVVGEFLGATQGIGYLISFATAMFDATGLFAGLTILIIFSALFDSVIGRIEQHFSVWKL